MLPGMKVDHISYPVTSLKQIASMMLKYNQNCKPTGLHMRKDKFIMRI